MNQLLVSECSALTIHVTCELIHWFDEQYLVDEKECYSLTFINRQNMQKKSRREIENLNNTIKQLDQT